MGPIVDLSVGPAGQDLRGDTSESSISANGRFVTYTSRNLRLVGLPRNGETQVFRYDRRSHVTVLVSVTPDGRPGTRSSSNANMSADGRVVVFTSSSADLLPEEPELNGVVVLARDMETGTTTLVSKTAAGLPPDGASDSALVTDDGSLVIYTTTSVDVTGVAGAVIYDRTADTSAAVTVRAGEDDVTPEDAWLSGDGKWVAFSSAVDGIVPDDDNGTRDAFVVRRSTGSVRLVSRAADGTPANGGSFFADGRTDPYSTGKPVVSRDGSRVIFHSYATDLAGAEDPGGGSYEQSYVYDTATQQSELVTILPDGTAAQDVHRMSTISPDGRYAVVRTQAYLDGGSGQLGPKIYVRDLDLGTTRAASSNAWGTSAGIGGRAPHVVFSTFVAVAPPDADSSFDVYLRRVW